METTEKCKEMEVEEEPFGLGCALEHFAEADEVFQMIDNIKNVYSDKSASEKAYEKFHFIVGQYKEQPHLLDSRLDEILEKFINIIRNNEYCAELKHYTFKYMFVIVNVRGYKVIVRHLPHEVPDFETVLKMLEIQDPTDAETWTTRYILLLWMSIIIVIPFDLKRFDCFDETEKKEKSVMQRVLDIIKTYVIVSDKCRDAASYLSAFFITRNDVKEIYLNEYLNWTTHLCESPESSVFIKYGTLASIAMILKHGKREDLLPYAPKLLHWIVNADNNLIGGSNVRKLVYKVIQRIGLIFLPPRVAAWRYKRGNRSLSANLSGGDTSTKSDLINDTSDDNNIDVPDEIEEVIDQLIQGLRSGDSIVRWSAAKGVGRVTSRLPQDLADDVVGSVLELFSFREGDSSWHGGCLALAELGRRGLLLPKRLPEVVPLIIKALVYDEPRGYSSVGSHIRDAACYVCWSFARAYDTKVLEPFVQEIAGALLVVACFDREINCRRAASAAFQENVGRQGTFPYGIDILTVADFFNVSVRTNSYLNVSVFIAQFEEYTQTLIDHLIYKKIDHWDIIIRDLTSKALHNLTPKAPDYMTKVVLPLLFEKSQSIDLNCRHGSVLAIGEIFHALSKVDKIENLVNDELIELTKNLISKYREKMYFRGMGGELMKQACCHFIGKCCLASFNFKHQQVIDDWLCLINESLIYNTASIRDAAIIALPILLEKYYDSPEYSEKQNKLIKLYEEELLSTISQENRMGHALALGALPKFLLLQHIDRIIDVLIESTIPNPITAKWAESRRDAIKALTSITTTLESEIGDKFDEKKIHKIYNLFLNGLKDYTQDKRGDVGAWVREAVMKGLQNITLCVCRKKVTILNEDLLTKILGGIVQQAVEKIDRTRAIAGKTFYSFIYNDIEIPDIPYHSELKEIFPREECDNLNWNSSSDTFSKFVQILKFPPYSYNLMVGLVCSVGGMTETLVKNSSSALFSFLNEQNNAEIQRLCLIIKQIFVDYLKNDRVMAPMFKFLARTIESGTINTVLQDDNSTFAKDLYKLIIQELSTCRDTYKLVDGVHLLCQFVQVKATCKSSLIQISIYLCHRQPYVRRSASTVLYETLLVYGDSIDINNENLDEIMQILSCTNWEHPVEEIRPVRNELCKLMGIRVPAPKAKN